MAYLGRSEILPSEDMDKVVPLRIPNMEPESQPWKMYTDDDVHLPIPDMASSPLRTPGHEKGEFKHLCGLMVLLAAVARNIYTPGGRDNNVLVNGLHTRLCSWYNLLPTYVRLSREATPTVLHIQ